jgi:DNA-binding CsgD family transcriptional regulator
MRAGVLGREAELARIDRELETARSRPTMLHVCGEAGIGKTVVLEYATERAAALGYEVLACAPSSAEAVMSYAGLGDLLGSLTSRLGGLPDPQRSALETALLRRAPGTHPPDVGSVGAALFSLLAAACREHPVLVAVDDVPWLDQPTVRALTFALRRLTQPFALICTVRDGFSSPLVEVLHHPHDEQGVLRLEGLGARALRQLVQARLQRPMERPQLERVHRISRGNPLFALELARSLNRRPGPSTQLPSALTQSMGERHGALPERAREALLVCSALAGPTSELLISAGIAAPDEALASAELEGIVRWRGNHVDFDHPMWREVVYQSAPAGVRRELHRRLSGAVTTEEERARHLAMGSLRLSAADLLTIRAGAESARRRGAPSAAAELSQLALGLGADDPELVLQTARDHFAAGDRQEARGLANRLLESVGAGETRAGALGLLGVIAYLADDFQPAATYLQQAWQEAHGLPGMQAGFAIDLALALGNLGRIEEGHQWALRATSSARASGDRGTVAEAAAALAALLFLRGSGVDAQLIDQALTDEDPGRPSPPIRWPVATAALLAMWSLDLNTARPALAGVRQRCADQGVESGLSLLLSRMTEAALWSGDIDAARALVDELGERASMTQDSSDLAMACTAEANLAAWRGDHERARTAQQAVLGLLSDSAHPLASVATTAALGMAELTRDETEAAAALLGPVAEVMVMLGVGEPVVSLLFPDAVDAYVAVGQPDRARPLVDLMETWGHRSGSAWPTGVGARGRAVLALHGGDLDGAADALERAMSAFGTDSMRYDRARTHLVTAALHRRRRERGQARDSLLAAAELFDQVGASGWSAKARRDLSRLGLQPTATNELTPSERRVAELAASGLTNASVAARLVVSAKTVEAHLSRIYRKLGIRSRAELGQWIANEAPTNRADA